MKRPPLKRLEPGAYRTTDGRYTLRRATRPGPRGGRTTIWTIDGEPGEHPTLAAAVSTLLTRIAGSRSWARGDGTVYLICLDRPFHHARHYIGWTNGATVEQRLAQHRAGQGANLLRHVNAAGIGYRVVRVWPGGRDLERTLKRRGGASRHCPRCRAAYRARRNERRRTAYRQTRPQPAPAIPDRFPGGNPPKGPDAAQAADDRSGAAARTFALLDEREPLPSWNDLAARIGIPPPLTRPGDLLERETDLQAYWPTVRPCWR